MTILRFYYIKTSENTITENYRLDVQLIIRHRLIDTYDNRHSFYKAYMNKHVL